MDGKPRIISRQTLGRAFYEALLSNSAKIQTLRVGDSVSFIASLLSISPDGVTKGMGDFEFVVTPRVGEIFSLNSEYGTEEYEVIKLEHWPIEVLRDEQEKLIPRVLIFCSHRGFAGESDQA